MGEDFLCLKTFNIVQFLRSAVATGASDEHLKVGQQPYIRKMVISEKSTMDVLTKEDLDMAILEIAPLSVRDAILSMRDLDFYV